MSTELARIAHLQRRFGPLKTSALHNVSAQDGYLDNGDDAAVLGPNTRSTVVTVDSSVEGVHFKREWMSLADIAHRAVHAAVSDVAAMGGVMDDPGAGVLFNLGFSAIFAEDEFEELIDGLASACAKARIAILGGNLTNNPVLNIGTTAIGRLNGVPLTRAGAQPGDALYVSGPLGGSAIGLAALQADRGVESQFAPFIARFRRPQARLELGYTLLGRATACIDVSDGLCMELWHLADASGVAIVLDAERVPTVAQALTLERELGFDSFNAALRSGEEYELVFTGPRARFAGQFAEIGHVDVGSGAWLQRHGNRSALVHTDGWDHFAVSSAKARA